MIKIAKDEGMDDNDIHVFQAGKPKQIKFVILQSYNINQYLQSFAFISKTAGITLELFGLVR